MVYPNFNFMNQNYPVPNYMNPQPQAIQNIQPTQPQSYCYFVRSSNDLNGINVMPNTFYVGINSDKNEIYVRRMNNDGLVDVKTYSLQSEKKEKTEFQAVFDRLDEIEKKISEISVPQRPVLTLKNKDKEEK